MHSACQGPPATYSSGVSPRVLGKSSQPNSNCLLLVCTAAPILCSRTRDHPLCSQPQLCKGSWEPLESHPKTFPGYQSKQQLSLVRFREFQLCLTASIPSTGSPGSTQKVSLRLPSTRCFSHTSQLSQVGLGPLEVPKSRPGIHSPPASTPLLASPSAHQCFTPRTSSSGPNLLSDKVCGPFHR